MTFALKLTRPRSFVIRASSPICWPFAGLQLIEWENSKDRIYMFRETKSTLDDSKLCPTGLTKIKSAKRRFEAIGIEDYARAVPGAWRL